MTASALLLQWKAVNSVVPTAQRLRGTRQQSHFRGSKENGRGIKKEHPDEKPDWFQPEQARR